MNNILDTPFGQELVNLLVKCQIDDKTRTPAPILATLIMHSIRSFSIASEMRDAYFDETEVKIPGILEEVKNSG